ncbi:MAG TPA: hypothetical protein VMU50_16890 [Polyangia bacterium]|nr:hypothetical protein [Polyangia bacterium]
MRRAVKQAWFAVAALVILTCGVARSATSKPICAPGARVDGPSDIVGPVRAIVAAHGVRVVIDADCRPHAVRALIERNRDGRGFTLTTVDESGRGSTRAFEDPATAASLIESWALDESAELLAPARAPPEADTAADTPLARTLLDEQAGARLHLQVGPETSLASDGSWWYGAAVGACARVGPLCTGAVLRSTRDADVSGASRTDSVERTNIDVLLTASWLLRARAVILAPTLAVGAGWLRTRTEGGLLQDAIVWMNRNLRTELSLQARWPVSARVALAAEIGGTWSPWAHSDEHVEDRAVLPGEPAARLRLAIFCAVTP